MDEALKKKLRTSYRGWMRTCSHCNGRKKDAHHKAYREGLREAVAYANTLALPEAFGGLRASTDGGFGSEFDVAHWGARDNQGVMHGDNYDGGPEAWYWKVPSGGPAKLRWKSTPAASLIDLVEYLEKTYGSPTIREGSVRCLPPSPESLTST